MAGFFILLGLSFGFLIFLAAESKIHNQQVNRIPLRISVSGTRGKSSIVRTLASVFRAHGIAVLAKTTGSEAMYILPDGTTEKIRRKGLTTILEQKKLIFKALQLDASCIITEIMSIHPENHQVETQKLIKPCLTLFSNFRADHTDVVGELIKEISELFVNDVFPDSTVIIPESEINEDIINGMRARRAAEVIAKEGISNELTLPETVSRKHIRTNLDLVVTAARHHGIPDATIVKGIIDAQLDIGQLGIFRIDVPERKIWFVNAFAANDPLSTLQLIAKTREILAPETDSETGIIGLLSLRADRGERSKQWLSFLQAKGKDSFSHQDQFSHLYVAGSHSRIFERKLKNCERLTDLNPEKITRRIIESSTGDIIVFGMVNIHGLGEGILKSLHSNLKVPWNTNSSLPVS